jgi:hypothetical protein
MTEASGLEKLRQPAAQEMKMTTLRGHVKKGVVTRVRAWIHECNKKSCQDWPGLSLMAGIKYPADE